MTCLVGVLLMALAARVQAQGLTSVDPMPYSSSRAPAALRPWLVPLRVLTDADFDAGVFLDSTDYLGNPLRWALCGREAAGPEVGRCSILPANGRVYTAPGLIAVLSEDDTDVSLAVCATVCVTLAGSQSYFGSKAWRWNNDLLLNTDVFVRGSYAEWYLLSKDALRAGRTIPTVSYINADRGYSGTFTRTNTWLQLRNGVPTLHLMVTNTQRELTLSVPRPMLACVFYPWQYTGCDRLSAHDRLFRRVSIEREELVYFPPYLVECAFHKSGADCASAHPDSSEMFVRAHTLEVRKPLDYWANEHPHTRLSPSAVRQALRLRNGQVGAARAVQLDPSSVRAFLQAGGQAAGYTSVRAGLCHTDWSDCSVATQTKVETGTHGAFTLARVRKPPGTIWGQSYQEAWVCTEGRCVAVGSGLDESEPLPVRAWGWGRFLLVADGRGASLRLLDPQWRSEENPLGEVYQVRINPAFDTSTGIQVTGTDTHLELVATGLGRRVLSKIESFSAYHASHRSKWEGDRSICFPDPNRPPSCLQPPNLGGPVRLRCHLTPDEVFCPENPLLVAVDNQDSVYAMAQDF